MCPTGRPPGSPLLPEASASSVLLSQVPASSFCLRTTAVVFPILTALSLSLQGTPECFWSSVLLSLRILLFFNSLVLLSYFFQMIFHISFTAYRPSRMWAEVLSGTISIKVPKWQRAEVLKCLFYKQVLTISLTDGSSLCDYHLLLH